MMKIFNKFFVSLSVMILGSGSAFAIDLPETMKQTMAHETAGMPSLLNLVISMIVVIALIYVTGWIYNKLNIVNREKLAKMGAKDTETHRFTVLQSMPLGQHRHMYSVEMNGKILLIGSTPSHINLIREFDKAGNHAPSQEDVSSKLEEDITEDVKNGNVDIEELFKKYKN